MLKNQLKNYFANLDDHQKIEIYKEEKDFAIKHGLISENVIIEEKTPSSRFLDAYIERSNKETEEIIDIAHAEILNQKLEYLKIHMNEFIYLESNWFEMIGVDAVSLEVDDVFRTYDVMLGLKLQKKFEATIKQFLKNKLHDETKFDLMFSADDGLWNLNFDLDSVEGFSEDMTIGDGFRLIYEFLFNLVVSVEEGK